PVFAQNGHDTGAPPGSASLSGDTASAERSLQFPRPTLPGSFHSTCASATRMPGSGRSSAHCVRVRKVQELLMQSSMFNVQVPVPARDEVFLMNTFTDAQLLVSSDVASLLARADEEPSSGWGPDERQALETLAEHGFLVPDRATERAKLEQFFR